jgi:glutamate--cysteine ligase
VQSLLATIVAEFGGEPQFSGPHLTGMRLANGMQITLEHGGALEYASAPTGDLVTAIEDMRAMLTRVADIARGAGLAILPGANLPFDRIEDVSWVPKPSGAPMRDFFADLGEPGALGPSVMALTLSTQTTVDYVSAEDFGRKLRMQVAASPLVSAMFVNSPLAGGELTPLLSTRALQWLACDPDRCGLLPFALRDVVTVDDFVDWALARPMIYHRTPDGDYKRAPARSFGELIATGFDDGTAPTRADWLSHLSQVWTDVRVRQTLELRGADGPPYAHVAAVPALWVGLTYHPPSCAAAWELLRPYTVEQQRALMRELPVRGLAATLGGDPVRDLGRELVRLARAGLESRVAAGLERPEAPDYLAPIEEVLDSGTTFAERTIARWENEFGRDPARYVAAYRV